MLAQRFDECQTGWAFTLNSIAHKKTLPSPGGAPFRSPRPGLFRIIWRYVYDLDYEHHTRPMDDG